MLQEFSLQRQAIEYKLAKLNIDPNDILLQKKANIPTKKRPATSTKSLNKSKNQQKQSMNLPIGTFVKLNTKVGGYGTIVEDKVDTYLVQKENSNVKVNVKKSNVEVTNRLPKSEEYKTKKVTSTTTPDTPVGDVTKGKKLFPDGRLSLIHI